jgi:TolB-like protein
VVKKETLLEECWNTHVQEDSLSQAIRAIRKALGDSRTDPKYIENVWGEGYSFIGKVREVGEGEGERIIEARVNQTITQPVAVPVETQLYNETIVATKKPAVLPPLQPGKRYSRSINRLEFASITLMMILAIMLIKPIFDELLGLRKPGPPKVEMPEPAPPQTVKDIAVLPVKFVSETGRDLGFSKAVTEEVISGLTRVNTVHVHSLKAVSTYTDSNVDPVVAGRELLADTVMQTVIKKVCDKFEITISLFLVANGKQLWQEVFLRRRPKRDWRRNPYQNELSEHFRWNCSL